MPHLLRPRITRAVSFALTMLRQMYIEGNQYLLKIQRAGGFRKYEAQVKKSLAAMLVPKFPQIPAEVIPTIVEFWAHAGDY